MRSELTHRWVLWTGILVSILLGCQLARAQVAGHASMAIVIENPGDRPVTCRIEAPRATARDITLPAGSARTIEVPPNTTCHYRSGERWASNRVEPGRRYRLLANDQGAVQLWLLPVSTEPERIIKVDVEPTPRVVPGAEQQRVTVHSPVVSQPTTPQRSAPQPPALLPSPPPLAETPAPVLPAVELPSAKPPALPPSSDSLLPEPTVPGATPTDPMPAVPLPTEPKPAVSQPAVPAPARRPAMRGVRVLVAGGKEYRAFHYNWQDRAHRIVADASRHFERQFGIRFKVVGYRAWDYTRAPKQADEAFQDLHRIALGDADLIVGFTMVAYPGSRGEVRGLTQYFSQYVVLPDLWGEPGAVTRLVHELSHVFGAFHVAEQGSVMLPGFERTPRTFQFGRAAEEVIPQTRQVDLARGVESLPEETQQSIRQLYRTYHHPSEDTASDPIVVGYRYQALRADMNGNEPRSQEMRAEMERLKAATVSGPANP